MGKKLFLGVSLSELQRREIAQLQNRLGDEIKPVPLANLHMTLCFFGLVSHRKQRKLEKQLTSLHKPAFSITLNRLAHWQKPKILCICGETKDKALLEVVKECQLLANKLHLYQSNPVFRAHITVARKARQLPERKVYFKPLTLRPKEIHLFESQSTQTGVKYEIQHSWRLK
jgi:2'-5' RNA ligase